MTDYKNGDQEEITEDILRTVDFAMEMDALIKEAKEKFELLKKEEGKAIDQIMGLQTKLGSLRGIIEHYEQILIEHGILNTENGDSEG